MRRFWASVVGILLITGAVIVVGKFLFPAKHAPGAKKEEDLTKEYAARLVECRFLEDTELPEGATPPEVGAPDLYLAVVIFYPGVAVPPKSLDFALDRINSLPQARVVPVTLSHEANEEGVTIHLVFLVPHDFQYSRLTLDGKPVLEKIVLQQ